jgi:2-methylcitrate dehydratase PrpD
MTTAAARFADFATSLTGTDIPDEVAEAAKLHLLDTLGCALASYAMGIGAEGQQVMAAQGGHAHATAIGLEERLPGPSAAFANGMLSHGLDYDDTHSDSMTHVTAVVGPAALAAAEARDADGRDLIAALVAGSEIVTRIGMAVTGRFHARGFHATAVCGVFGAAAAAARLAGLPPEAATSALGIAGSFAGGLFAYLEEGTATKFVNPAWAAHGGLLAVELAAHGGEGPSTILEGRFGLYHAFADADPGSVDLDAQLRDLGSRWETPRIAFKPYPACHFVHGSVGSASALLASIAPSEIEAIEATIPAPAVPIVLEPAEVKVAPRTDYEGKFSLQYCTAAMLATGRLDVATFSENLLHDETIAELARKVTYTVRDYDTWPAAFPGGIRITMRDGRVLEADQPHQLGSPDNPMSTEQIVGKFRSNGALALDDADVEALESSVLTLEAQDNLTRVADPLRRARMRASAATAA